MTSLSPSQAASTDAEREGTVAERGVADAARTAESPLDGSDTTRAATVAPPAPAPTPRPAGRPRRTEQRPAPTPPKKPARHGLPKVAVLLLAIMILAPVGWWLVPLIPWTPPWLRPAGPLVASGTLEADEVLVGSEVSGRI